MITQIDNDREWISWYIQDEELIYQEDQWLRENVLQVSFSIGPYAENMLVFSS